MRVSPGSASAAADRKHVKGRARTPAERRQIVEASLAPGATVAEVAAAYGMQSSYLSFLRKLYRQGRLGKMARPSRHRPHRQAPKLLAVEVIKGRVAPVARRTAVPPSGRMELELARGQVRILGAVDSQALRLVLEGLR
ncbi:MAG: transposase [Acetobacteraceae bacterium]|nr:transposase [Acetobacteraceae bacterium]